MDKLTAMHSFLRVAEKGSFSAVAEEENTSQGTISKRVAALEAALGVRLLQRSSRHQTLTEAGERYAVRCQNILDEIDAAEHQARAQLRSPRGTLRVTMPIDLSAVILEPILQPFLHRYPEIKLDLLLDNQMLNLTDEGLDVAIRAGALNDSSLIARPLCFSPQIIVAAPSYLATHGTPTTPQALSQHNCILYRHTQTVQWQFDARGQTRPVRVDGNLRSSSGQVLKTSAIAGIGITRLPYWFAQDALANGQLVQLLQDYPGDRLPIQALYHQRSQLPQKISVFVDFLSEAFASHPAFCPG